MRSATRAHPCVRVCVCGCECGCAGRRPISSVSEADVKLLPFARLIFAVASYGCHLRLIFAAPSGSREKLRQRAQRSGERESTRKVFAVRKVDKYFPTETATKRP